MAEQPPTRDEMLRVVVGQRSSNPDCSLVRVNESGAGTLGDQRLSPRARTPASASPGPSPRRPPSIGQEVSDEADQRQGGGPRRAQRHRRGLLPSATAAPLDRGDEEVVHDHFQRAGRVGSVADGGGGDHRCHGGDRRLLEARVLRPSRGSSTSYGSATPSM